jgi:DNA mismatch repair ATPase MutL
MEKKEKVDSSISEYFKDLLDDIELDEETEVEAEEETEEETSVEDDGESDDLEEESEEEKRRREEEQRRKNKNAEEARKRREREAKEKKAQDKSEEQRNELGRQLVDFKKKYPDVDLAALDNDKRFARFIEGKLLGKKDFTQLYEEYVDFVKEIGGTAGIDIQKEHMLKERSSSGSSRSSGGYVSGGSDVYSERDLERIAARIPFMTEKEAMQVLPKFEKSIEFYKNKK